MYRKILKKDLKRKKTMNTILLLFIILATTFIASSMNNVISIATAMDVFFEKAGLSDYIIIALQNEANHTAAAQFLSGNEQVEEYVIDNALIISEAQVILPEERSFQTTSTIMITSLDIAQSLFFNENNEEISRIEEGEIYMNQFDLIKNEIQIGDCLTLSEGGFSKEFVVKGIFKDALFGSAMMGMKRFLVSQADFDQLYREGVFPKAEMYSVDVNDLKQFLREYNENAKISAMLSCDISLVRFSYVVDMMAAAILLIVSICLILISMVILRFTIVFTLQEEFREIGIMKAIGITNARIRRLYIVKYLMLAVVGTVIGVVLSIPFGKMLLQEVSENIVMSNDTYGWMAGLLGAVLVILIIMLFSYSCTGTVTRFSPIDAIRNGSNGERFHKKAIIKLSKSPGMSPAVYMALNDIISSPRRFGVLFLVFMLGIILIIIPINCINTLEDGKLITLFGMLESDAYLTSDGEMMKLMEKGDRQHFVQYLEMLEQKMSEKGIKGKATLDLLISCKASMGEERLRSNTWPNAFQGIGTTADQYTYIEGYPPAYANEVALSHITAEQLQAVIGDTVTIEVGETEREYLVSGLFQTMSNLGEGIRFHEDAQLDYKNVSLFCPIQITFEDHANEEGTAAKREELKEIFPEFTIYSSKEYIMRTMGGITEKLSSLKQLIIAVVITINMLVAVLMVKSFITREKGEVGILKSIGFSNGGVIQWQTCRIGIIMLLSVLTGTLISKPLGQVFSGATFGMMGARSVTFTINPLEVYLLYPVLLFTLTILASMATALEIRKIQPREIMNVE